MAISYWNVALEVYNVGKVRMSNLSNSTLSSVSVYRWTASNKVQARSYREPETGPGPDDYTLALAYHLREDQSIFLTERRRVSPYDPIFERRHWRSTWRNS